MILSAILSSLSIQKFAIINLVEHIHFFLRMKDDFRYYYIEVRIITDQQNLPVNICFCGDSYDRKKLLT